MTQTTRHMTRRPVAVPLERITLRLDPDAWRSFCRVADRKGLHSATLLRMVMAEYINEQLTCHVEA
jgi:hypothetical protein